MQSNFPKKLPKVIILRETILESIIKDVFTLGSLAVLVGIGVVLSSEALQWIGAIFWMLIFVSKESREVKHSYTLEEAKTLIDKLYDEKNSVVRD